MTPKWDHIKEIEIELSSRCNAACPGCKRTAMLNRGEYFSQEDITTLQNDRDEIIKLREKIFNNK